MKIKLECDYALVDEMCVDEEYEKFVKQINLRRKARGLSPMQEWEWEYSVLDDQVTLRPADAGEEGFWDSIEENAVFISLFAKEPLELVACSVDGEVWGYWIDQRHVRKMELVAYDTVYTCTENLSMRDAATSYAAQKYLRGKKI